MDAGNGEESKHKLWGRIVVMRNWSWNVNEKDHEHNQHGCECKNDSEDNDEKYADKKNYEESTIRTICLQILNLLLK